MAGYSPSERLPFSCVAPDLGKLYVMVLERKRADPLASGTKEGVEHCWRGNADRRLTNPTPETATRHDDGFDLGHLCDPHRVIGIEVLLFDTPAVDRALLIEQC